MKSKQVLDVQQMQHLQEMDLELDYDTLYRYVKFEDTDWLLKPFSDLNIIGISCKYIPAYTLQDVLDALPKEIVQVTNRYQLRINLAYSCIDYCYEDFNYIEFRKRVFWHDGENELIDAAYEMLVWCIEGGYIETNKNE